MDSNNQNKLKSGVDACDTEDNKVENKNAEDNNAKHSDAKLVLHCDKLARYYQQGNTRIEVLRAIDFSISHGERIAVIGSSGSGKSTLLALLGGLDKPDAGNVVLLEQSMLSLNDNQLSRLRNRSLGFVYQFHHLLPEFNALENVALPHLLATGDKNLASNVAIEWLEKVGLSDRAKHFPSELSGGERQRVAIARALVNRPACVLMDEPTGNLDSESSKMVLQCIDEMSRNGDTAFVIVTHDASVASIMDKTYRLADGSITLIESQAQ